MRPKFPESTLSSLFLSIFFQEFIMAGKSKAQAIKFGKINRSALNLKNTTGKTSRTGQSTGGKMKAHGKIHKHS